MITDDETSLKEADIIINGERLTFSQAMTVRVALHTFFMQMSSGDALGKDEAGRSIRQGYYLRTKEILDLIHQGVK